MYNSNVNKGMLMVSVIVPVYNIERYIEKCMDSIIAQSYTNLEIIMIDDCSTDNSHAICQKYAAGDSRVTLLRNDKNSGVSFSRNRALSIASGEYVFMVDGDDWIESNCIELMVEAIENSNAEMCACGYIKDYDSGNKSEHFRITNEACIKENHAVLDCAMQKNVPFVGYAWAKLYIKKAIDASKLQFDPAICVCEDSLFNYTYLDSIKNCVLMDECLYHYRIRPESATRSASPAKIKTKVDAFQKALKIAKKYPNSLFFYRINATIFEASIHYINLVYQAGNQIDKRELKCMLDLAKSSKKKTKMKFISQGAFARYILFKYFPNMVESICIKKKVNV